MPRFLRNALFLSCIVAAPAVARAAPDVDTYTISLNGDAITGFSHSVEMAPITPSVDAFDLAVGTTYTFEDLNKQSDAAQTTHPPAPEPAVTSDRVTLNLHENGTYNLYTNLRTDSDSAAPASLMPVPLALVLIFGTGAVAFVGTTRRKLRRH